VFLLARLSPGSRTGHVSNGLDSCAFDRVILARKFGGLVGVVGVVGVAVVAVVVLRHIERWLFGF